MSPRFASPFGTVILPENRHENVLERMFGEGMPEVLPRNSRVPAVGVYETKDAFILLLYLSSGCREEAVWMHNNIEMVHPLLHVK